MPRLLRYLSNNEGSSSAATAVAAFFLLASLSLFTSQLAHGQTFQVIHTFTGETDGGNDWSGLVMDQAGNLYGSAGGGLAGNCWGGACGLVFKLSRAGSAWTLSPVYLFQGGADGDGPFGLSFGSDGSLYGATSSGGYLGGGCGSLGCGTIFKLTRASCGGAICTWAKSVLFDFSGSNGNSPGGVVFDHAGNLYGTTALGGSWNLGTLFKLKPSNGEWIETVLHSFGGPADGEVPTNPVTLSANGVLYGTLSYGSSDYGRVYQWTSSGGYSTIYVFRDVTPNSGGNPYTGVILDGAGNLYGTTVAGGFGGGTVFEMFPRDGSWGFANIYNFTGFGIQGPESDLLMDAAGNLYGTTFGDGAHGNGTVFKLTRGESGWTYTDLYDFTGGADGGGPIGTLVMDSSGNLYGAAEYGGNPACYQYGCGVVFEITP